MLLNLDRLIAEVFVGLDRALLNPIAAYECSSPIQTTSESAVDAGGLQVYLINQRPTRSRRSNLSGSKFITMPPPLVEA